MGIRAERKAERQRIFNELMDKGASKKEIFSALNLKSSRTYYDMRRVYEGKSRGGVDTQIQYAPQIEPKAVPVTIKGERYLDVTSFFT